MTLPTSPHRRRRHLAACATAAVTCLLLQVSYDGGVPALAEDVWSYRANGSRVADSQQLADHLTDRLARSRQRTEVRTGLLDDLKARRKTLAAVGEEYSVILSHDPLHLAVIRRNNCGDSDAEKVANLFLSTLANYEDVPAEAMARLTNEFRESFGREPTWLTASPPSRPAPAASERPVPHLLPVPAHVTVIVSR